MSGCQARRGELRCERPAHTGNRHSMRSPRYLATRSAVRFTVLTVACFIGAFAASLDNPILH